MTSEEYDAALAAIAATSTAAALQAMAAMVVELVGRSAAAEAIALVIAQANSLAASLADAWLAERLSGEAGRPVLPVGVVRPRHEFARLESAADTVLRRVEAAPPIEAPEASAPRTDRLPNTERPSAEPKATERPADRPRASAARPSAPARPTVPERTRPRTSAPDRPSAPPTPATPRAQDVADLREVRAVDGAGSVERLARSEPLAAAAETVEQVVQRSPLVVAYRREVSANACERCLAWAEGGRRIPAKRPFKRHNGCTCKQVPIIKEIEGK